MGYVEVYMENQDKWVDINDVPYIETVNCQLCNEPTQASDIMAKILIKDGQVSVGQWQCRKCHAVNG